MVSAEGGRDIRRSRICKRCIFAIADFCASISKRSSVKGALLLAVEEETEKRGLTEEDAKCRRIVSRDGMGYGSLCEALPDEVEGCSVAGVSRVSFPPRPAIRGRGFARGVGALEVPSDRWPCTTTDPSRNPHINARVNASCRGVKLDRRYWSRSTPKSTWRMFVTDNCTNLVGTNLEFAKVVSIN